MVLEKLSIVTPRVTFNSTLYIKFLITIFNFLTHREMPMSMRVTENKGNKMYLFFPLIEMPMIVIKNKVNKVLLATSMPFKRH